MIEAIDLLSLETSVRDYIGEEQAKFWTQARVFRAINSEMLTLARRIIALDKGWFEVVATPTPADSYALPTNCHLVRNVQLYIGGAWTSPNPIGDHARGQYQSFSTSGNYPYAWRVQDNTIHFESGIGSATQMRVCYARLPASMQYQNVSATTSTTVQFSTGANIDDVYIGDRVLVTGGTGAGQTNAVTDYVASTYTITVSSWANGGVDTTSYISWMLPHPLSDYPDVVALGAARELLMRRRDTEMVQVVSSMYEPKVIEMLETLSQRQTMAADRGNFLSDWGDD